MLKIEMIACPGAELVNKNLPFDLEQFKLVKREDALAVCSGNFNDNQFTVRRYTALNGGGVCSPFKEEVMTRSGKKIIACPFWKV